MPRQNPQGEEMESLEGDHKAKTAHVLAIPYPRQGHLNPLLNFMTQLARKGITVSFVCFADAIPSLPTISSVADDGASSDLPRSLDSFRFITVHRPADYRDRPFGLIEIFRDSFKPLLEKLVHNKNAGISPGPTCIISDAFLTWTLDVAKELRIPRYAMVPSGVIFVRLMQGSLEYFERGQFQVSKTDGKLIEFDWPIFISGLPPLRYHDLNLYLRSNPAGFRETAESVVKSAGVLVNSFLELEEKVVEAWRSLEESTEVHIKVPRIYPVGPLFSTNVLQDSTITLNNRRQDSSSKCLVWLGSQSPSSVLYVAFGSLTRLHPKEINEMAHGLEASKQRFLWVIPQSNESSEEEIPSIAEILPQGFEARVADRGFIETGWAPQLQILAHPSTGGFLTHSGWNSSLESITFGVPMIAWPQSAEQHLNCRYLVDELKVAEQLQTGKEKVLKHGEVERAVHLLMVEPEGMAMRNNVQELRRKAAVATSKGGSKLRMFQDFLDEISTNPGIINHRKSSACEQ